jgi:hypothetical protein
MTQKITIKNELLTKNFPVSFKIPAAAEAKLTPCSISFAVITGLL